MLPAPQKGKNHPLLPWRALAAVLLAAVLLASPTAGAARTPAAEDTWAAEWSLVGPGARAEQVVARSAVQGTAAGGDLQVENGFSAGGLEWRARDMGREFTALGAIWEAQMPEGAELVLEVCLSRDGVSWGAWQPLIAEEDLAPEGTPEGQGHSELLFARGRYIRARVWLTAGAEAEPWTLRSLKLVAIDASAGPRADALLPGVSGAGAVASSAPTVISRAQWGANESYRWWTPSYAPVKAFVIHHTATSNAAADSDPYNQVRIIYYYHAVSLNWGDIGYNYLVDRQGRIYEGRYGGDGVIAGHARPYNTGTVGVAILGTYEQDSVPAAAVATLKHFLAWKCGVHGVDALGSSFVYDRVFPNIMGHRDCNDTTCPGNRAYSLLPQIRADVAVMTPPPLTLSLSEPAAGQAVAGVTYVRWQAAALATQITIAVDGQVRQTLPAAETSWPWNTTAHADGSHLLRVTATDQWGRSTYAEVRVTVDNTPPTGSVSAPAVTSSPGVTLTLSCQGCTSVQFGRGWRWEGEDLRHQVGRKTADPAAANGWAWIGQAGVDGWGAWYGPYYCSLPYPGDYEAVFWLRSGRNDVATQVAEIDVSDQAGTRYLAPARPILATDLAALGRYQPFSILFRYPDQGTSCRSGATGDGLELRTWYQGSVDLWLDRVEIFTAAQPMATNVWLPLPDADGRHVIEVRFKDAAGNASSVYSQVVTVDREPTVWGQPGSAGLPVSDESGLATAACTTSDDGVRWGEWQPVTLALAPGGRSGTVPAQEAWRGRCVRARVYDALGNVSYSPPIRWPAASDPAPVYEWWTGCGARSYLPLVVR